jgi:hypothetical protein
LLCFGVTVLLTCLFHPGSTAHAVQKNVSSSQQSAQRAGLLPITLPGPLPPIGGAQVNNQASSGSINNGNVTSFLGANEGNSGNQGLNRGFTQDNTVNLGNEVSGQRRVIGTQVNNQYQRQTGGGASGSNNTTSFAGIDQGNSGNEGINLGHNQDNAGNSGNQVNNQGNIIGTQINSQGSDVTNQGDIIEKQVNYVTLLPGVHLGLSLQPKLRFGLSLGN